VTVAEELVLYAGSFAPTPFRELVDAASSAGFDAITVWPLTYHRAMSREGLDPATMRRIVDDAGLRVTDIDACGDWLPATEGQPEAPPAFRSVWARHDFFDAAGHLGADTVVAVHLTGGEVLHEVAVEGLAGLCDDAAEHGLRVALEFMPFSGIRDLRAGWQVVREADRPNGGLVVDVCHLTRGGWDEALLRSVPADRIFAVQLGDGPAQPPDDLVDEAMYHRLAPGTGDFDVAGVLAVLSDMGVRTRVGPEIYQRSWVERPAAIVASELIAATRRVLSDAAHVHG
jgi:sugar phosphate isomerase/epimerase